MDRRPLNVWLSTKGDELLMREDGFGVNWHRHCETSARQGEPLRKTMAGSTSYLIPMLRIAALEAISKRGLQSRLRSPTDIFVQLVVSTIIVRDVCHDPPLVLQVGPRPTEQDE